MFGIVYQKHSVYGRVCEDLVGENHLRYIGKLPEQLFPRISALLVSDDNYFHTQQASMNKSYRKMKRREDYSKWINRAGSRQGCSKPEPSYHTRRRQVPEI